MPYTDKDDDDEPCPEELAKLANPTFRHTRIIICQNIGKSYKSYNSKNFRPPRLTRGDAFKKRIICYKGYIFGHMDRLYWTADDHGNIAGVAFGSHYVVDKYTLMHKASLKVLNDRIVNYQWF